MDTVHVHMDEDTVTSRPNPAGNQTDFYPQDVDPPRRERMFIRLRKTNGHYTGKWRDEQTDRDMDNLERFRIIAARLELSKAQRTDAELRWSTIEPDMKRAYGIHALSFATCLHVLNECAPQREGLWQPDAQLVADAPGWIQVAKRDLDIPTGLLAGAYGKLDRYWFQ